MSQSRIPDPAREAPRLTPTGPPPQPCSAPAAVRPQSCGAFQSCNPGDHSSAYSPPMLSVCIQNKTQIPQHEAPDHPISAGRVGLLSARAPPSPHSATTRASVTGRACFSRARTAAPWARPQLERLSLTTEPKGAPRLFPAISPQRTDRDVNQAHLLHGSATVGPRRAASAWGTPSVPFSQCVPRAQRDT